MLHSKLPTPMQFPILHRLLRPVRLLLTWECCPFTQTPAKSIT